MRSNSTRAVATCAAILMIFGISFYTLQDKEKSAIEERLAAKKAYSEKLAEHPFMTRQAVTPEELKAIPKKDRPDLAWEHEVLMTMDPATGEVPKERLNDVFRTVQEFIDDPSRYAPGDPTLPWEERGPDNVGGRTRAVLWDPNVTDQVWAGGVGGGLWYTTDITDAAQPWVAVDNFWANIAVSSIAYDPTNTQIFYVGTGEGWGNADAIRGLGIWKTTDGGTSWSQLPSTANSSFRYVQKIIVDPVSGDVYAGTNSGLRRSQNGGTSWSQVLGSGNGAGGNFVCDAEVAADNSFWVAIDGDDLYRSTTGNAGSWVSISGTGYPAGPGRQELGVAPSNSQVAYVINEGGGQVDAIYYTADGGANWANVGQPNDADGGIAAGDFSRNQAWYDLTCEVDPNDPNTCWVGAIDLFKTTNAGGAWLQTSHWYGGFGFPYVHADQHMIKYKPGSSSEIAFGNDGGMFYTANATAGSPSFTNRNNGYNVTQYYAVAMHPGASTDNYLCGAQDNGTQRYTSAGMNSTTEASGGDGMFCHIDQTAGVNQVSSYVYNNYYVSTNSGASFGGIGGENTGRFVNPTDYDNNLNILYGARNASTLYRVTGIGTTNSSGTIAVGLSGTASAVTVSPYTLGSSRLFVGTGGGDVYRIDNADTAPTTTNIDAGGSLPFGYVSCIELGANENEILVVLSNYGVNSVWYTLDGGANWNSKEGNLPDMPIRWALFNPDDYEECIVATEVGVWSTGGFSAASPTWVPSNTGLANVRVDMLQYRASDKQVAAGTHGRGMFTGYFFNPTTVNDAGIPAISVPVGISCNATQSPEVTLRNYGSVALTQVDILYNVDGAPNSTFAWTGTLLPGNSVTVTLPSQTFAVGAHTFNCSTANPNGATDDDTANDASASSFTIGNNVIYIDIVTDRWGAETTWEITDAGSNVVFSGGPYVNEAGNGEYPQPQVSTCLIDGCYDFTIYDSFGDGMCCAYGNGSYTVLDAGLNVLITGGAGWLNSETMNFCVSNPVPTVNNDAGITAIIDPSGDYCDGNITPTVRLFNYGLLDLTSVDIITDIDGGGSSTFNWTGTLTTGSSIDVVLPAIVAPNGSHTYNATVSLPNGVVDEDMTNDANSSLFHVFAHTITVNLILDRYGAETTWDIVDVGLNVVASGGPYTNQGANGEYPQPPIQVCLDDGCYDFTIYDSFGDGICCAYGNGEYTLLDDALNVLVTGGPGWTISETMNFCLASATPTTYYSVATGNASAAVWNPNPGPGIGQVVTFDPTISLVCQNGYTVTQDVASIPVNDFTIESGGVFDMNITGNTMDVVGNFMDDGTLTGGDGVVRMIGSASQNIGGLSNTLFFGLEINNPAGVILMTDKSVLGPLDLQNGTFDNSAANFTFDSNASGTGRILEIQGGASITSAVTARRHVSGTNAGYRMLGNSLSGVDLTQWNDDFITTGFPGSDFPAYPFVSIWDYDETAIGLNADIDSGFVAPAGLSDVVAPGYARWAYLDPVPMTVEINGVLNQGATIIPVTYTPSATVPINDGWNLRANPFQCTVDWDAVSGWTKNNLDATWYAWNNDLQQFAAYTTGGVGTAGASRYIAPMQGLWVKSNAPGPLFSADETVKINQDALYIREDEEFANDVLRLILNGPEWGDEAIIYFRDYATEGIDSQADAFKLFSRNPMAPALTTVVNVNDELTELTTNGLPTVHNGLEIPVNFRAKVDGDYTINFNDFDPLYTGACLIMEDLQTGTMTPVEPNGFYTFEATVEDDETRFIIHVGTPMEFNSESNACFGMSNGLAEINVPGGDSYTYVWYDDLGNELKTTTNVTDGDFLDHLSAGVYWVEITGENLMCGTVTQEFEITEPAAPLAEILTSNIPECNAGDRGSIRMDLQGGLWNVTLWKDGETVQNWLDVEGILNLQDLVSGQYSIEAISECASFEQTVDLTDPDGIEASFTAPETLYLDQVAVADFINTTSGTTENIWSTGDGFVGYSQDIYQHTFLEEGMYQVSLLAGNGRCQDLATKWVEVLETSVGVEEEINGDFIHLVQNLGDINLQMDFIQPVSQVKVDLFNMNGQVVWSKQLGNVSNETLRIGESQFAQGVYHLRVTSNTEVLFDKKLALTKY